MINGMSSEMSSETSQNPPTRRAVAVFPLLVGLFSLTLAVLVALNEIPALPRASGPIALGLVLVLAVGVGLLRTRMARSRRAAAADAPSA